MKHGALPVNRRLQILSIITSVKCTFCDAEETTLHIFFHCPFAKQVWDLVPCASPVDTSMAESGDSGLTLDRFFSIEETIIKALVGGKEWQNAQDNPLIKIPKKVKLHQPREEGIICRSNGAWKAGTLAAGAAWSFYSNNGEMITSHSKLISYVNSSLVAEGLALREAMEHALSLGFNRVNFESDSTDLVAAIVDGACVSVIHGIASDISLLSSAFVYFSLRYCNRTSLCFEDGLAKQVLGSVCTRL
ncbi:Reverse transcriptase zinc-binding domain-containing protein [Hirschfeldia incana]|nr:Reverse transcriptase zinc-binding domain-containing protein [Hirschfeldia incana]